jgi:thioredoxin reductase (NADPH)
MDHDTEAGVDCLVVGGGPAGLSTTLYLRRFHRRVVLVDRGQSRALRIDCTHNMPGFPEGIAGHALLERMRRQVAGVHGTVTEAEVSELEHDGEGGFAARVGQRRLRTRRVVLATGVVDREPALPGLALLRERGLVRHCPICDGHEHSGKRIVVLGDGAHAQAEAAFLAHYSPHVTRVGVAEPVLAAPDADGAEPAIGCLPSTAHRVASLRDGGLVMHLSDGTRHAFDVLYVAMGVSPRRDLALPLGARLDPKGSLAIDEHCRTSVPGLYAVGDVAGGLDQLAVAAAHGAIAATAVHNSL